MSEEAFRAPEIQPQTQEDAEEDIAGEQQAEQAQIIARQNVELSEARIVNSVVTRLNPPTVPAFLQPNPASTFIPEVRIAPPVAPFFPGV